MPCAGLVPGCCSSCVACRGSIPCSVPCSGPRTERACPCPSPKGWCRENQGVSSKDCPSISAWPCGCCSVYCFAWAIRSSLGGGLCAPRLWMMCVSMFPSVRLPAFVSSMLHNDAAQQGPSETPASAPEASQQSARAQGQANCKIPTLK